MSGKTSDGGCVLFCPRKPRTATIAITHKIKMTKNPRSILVLVHDGDMPAAGLLEQLVHAVFRKARVASFYCKKESIIGHAAEAFPVEHRMVPARQAIHSLPCKKCSERGEKHRELEHDGEECRNGEETLRFPVHVEWVEKR